MAVGGEGAKRLKAELSKWRGLRRRYPGDLKGRAVAWARKRRAGGASYDVLAADLGISVMTVWEWLKAPAGKQRPKRRKKLALLPVEIVPARLPKPLGEGREKGPQAGVPGPVVVIKGGARVEGLCLEEIAALLRSLS